MAEAPRQWQARVVQRPRVVVWFALPCWGLGACVMALAAAFPEFVRVTPSSYVSEETAEVDGTDRLRNAGSTISCPVRNRSLYGT
jgi:hypothetical protein